MNINNLLQSSLFMVINSLMTKAIGLISTLILARTLLPEDFGIIAIVVVIGLFFESIGSIGMQEYIICRKKITSKVLHTAFTLNLITKSILAIFLVICTPLIADYFADDRLSPLLNFYALIIFIRGIENPAHFIMKREQNYKNIVIVNVIGKFIAVIVAVTIALSTESYWALIIGTSIEISIVTIGLYIIYPYVPKLSLYNIKEQFNYSKWLILQALIGYGRIHLDTFIASTNFGKSYLGAYNTMKYLAIIPSLNIITPMTSPLLAQLANFKDNKNHFLVRYNSAFLFIAIVSIPSYLFLFTYSKEIILLLMGENWVNFSDIFKYLVLMIIGNIFLTTSRPLYMMRGNTKPIFLFEVICTLTIISVLVSVDFNNIQEFAIAKVLVETIICLLFFCVTIQLKMGLKNLIHLLITLFNVFLVTYISILISELVNIENNLLELSFKVITFGTSYLTLIMYYLYILKSKHRDAEYIYELVIEKTNPVFNLLKK